MTSNKFNRNWILLLITIFSFGCEEKIDWEFPNDNNPRIAITAILTNENKIQNIEIYQSISDPNLDPVGIDNADVRIFTDNNTISFLPDPNSPGNYISPIAFATPFNQTINLEILHEDQKYEASTSMGTVTPIPPIEIGLNPISERRFIRKIADIYSPIEQAMYQVELDWSAIEPDTMNSALLFAYTFNTVDISGILAPNTESVEFPSGTFLLEKKFGLTSDYAEYLRSLAIEINWQGGAFDESQTSLQSNISNGALGYFSACQVLSDTIIVQ